MLHRGATAPYGTGNQASPQGWVDLPRRAAGQRTARGSHEPRPRPCDALLAKVVACYQLQAQANGEAGSRSFRPDVTISGTMQPVRVGACALTCWRWDARSRNCTWWAKRDPLGSATLSLVLATCAATGSCVVCCRDSPAGMSLGRSGLTSMRPWMRVPAHLRRAQLRAIAGALHLVTSLGRTRHATGPGSSLHWWLVPPVPTPESGVPVAGNLARRYGLV